MCWSAGGEVYQGKGTQEQGSAAGLGLCAHTWACRGFACADVVEEAPKLRIH